MDEDTRILSGLSVSIKDKEIMGLLGPNGSGKTTFINVLLGKNDLSSLGEGSEVLLRSFTGETLSIKRDYKSFRQHIRFCPQSDIIQEELTVREHIEMTMRLLGIPLTIENINKKAEAVDLSKQIDCLAKKLSPGGKRKLSICQALIGNPKLLILDEPTANLDLLSREDIWGVITRLFNNNSHKLSILVSTQHIEEAEHLSNRILIINQGKDIACDTPAKIKDTKGLAMRIVCQQNPQKVKYDRDDKSE